MFMCLFSHHLKQLDILIFKIKSKDIFIQEICHLHHLRFNKEMLQIFCYNDLNFIKGFIFYFTSRKTKSIYLV